MLPELNNFEKIKVRILKAKENDRKFWADFELTREEKDYIKSNFLIADGYDVTTEVCPRNLWTVIVKFV